MHYSIIALLGKVTISEIKIARSRRPGAAGARVDLYGLYNTLRAVRARAAAPLPPYMYLLSTRRYWYLGTAVYRVVEHSYF
eukprot:SAG31_NODE_4724_length_3006_cov_1.802202_1_plen_81_part_00